MFKRKQTQYLYSARLSANAHLMHRPIKQNSTKDSKMNNIKICSHIKS